MKKIDMTGWKMNEHGVPNSRWTVCAKDNLKGINDIGFFNVMIAVIEHILMNLEILVFIVSLSGDLIIWLDVEWSEDNEIN